MKKQTLFSLTLVVLCLLFVLGGYIFSSDVNKSLTRKVECTLRDRVCQFVDELGSLSIVFEQSPVLEEEINVKIHLSENLLLTNAWVEGVNMYMGKTPLIPEHTLDFQPGNHNLNAAGLFQALFFLGSCTEPRMQWAMVLEIENTVTEQFQAYKVLFTTRNH